MQPKVQVRVSDLLKKFRTLQDRINFCRENNMYLPSGPGFDSKFFVQVLEGRKRLLPLGMGTGFSFRYFTSSHLFTKAYIWNYFANDLDLKAYIPDDVSVESLGRDYLFSVLAFVRKDLYLSMYNNYKKIIADSPYSKYEMYGVEVESEMAKKIQSFIGSSSNRKSKPFRLSKNGQPIQEIQRMQNPQVQQNHGQVNNNVQPPQNNMGNNNAGNVQVQSVPQNQVFGIQGQVNMRNNNNMGQEEEENIMNDYNMDD